MTEPAGVTVEMRSRLRLVEPERILPDHVVDAKSALRPEALKPKFTEFRVVARLGSPPRASCATADRASRPHYPSGNDRNRRDGVIGRAAAKVCSPPNCRNSNGDTTGALSEISSLSDVSRRRTKGKISL